MGCQIRHNLSFLIVRQRCAAADHVRHDRTPAIGIMTRRNYAVQAMTILAIVFHRIGTLAWRESLRRCHHGKKSNDADSECENAAQVTLPCIDLLS